MDPIHLLPLELDYELEIRGVFNLSTGRQKTTCLREFLKREEEGERTISQERLDKLNSTEEIIACGQSLENVTSIMQEEGFEVSLRHDCSSRLIHLISRIKRARPTSPEEQTLVYEILITAEAQLAKFNRALVASGASRRASRQGSSLSSPLAEALEAIQGAKRASSTSINSFNGLAAENQNSTHGRRRSVLNPTVPSFVPGEQERRDLNLEFSSQMDSAPPTNRTSERNNAIRDIRTDRSGPDSVQAHNNEFRIQPDRPVPYQGPMSQNNASQVIQADSAGPYLGPQARNNLFRDIQVSTSGPYSGPSAQVNTAGPYSGPNAQVNRAGPYSGPNAPYNAFHHIQGDRSGPNPGPQPHYNVVRDILNNQSGPHPVSQAQNNAFRSIQGDQSGPNPGSQSHSNVVRDILQNRPGPHPVSQVFNNGFPNCHGDRADAFSFAQRPIANRAAMFENFDNERRVHDPQLYRPAQVPPLYERGGDAVYDRVSLRDIERPYRKVVPVHQWKLSFSGEGQGLHLYDFLSELSMFQRSEGVSDNELFTSVVHLLTGRARLWYRSWYDTFRHWGELVAAMKKEFLPPKFDYKLLSSISNRKQKTTETFAEYVNWMQSMFKHMSIPMDEQHKLCIIEENMLPKYAIATSAIEVNSLEQLSNVCRRVDFAYAKSAGIVPVDRGAAFRPPFRPSQGQSRPRELNELGTVPPQPYETGFFAGLSIGEDDNYGSQQQVVDQHQEREILELRRGGNTAASARNEVDRRVCFNCRRAGHNFSACPTQKNGQFCYRCGSRDVTTFTCKNCAKNGELGPDLRESLPDPQNH